MGRFTQTLSGATGVFGTEEWKATKIETQPENYKARVGQSEYIRVTSLMSNKPINRRSVSGLLVVDIFVETARGPRRGSEIADLLDSFLANKSFAATDGMVQFLTPAYQAIGEDKDLPSLYHYSFTVPFNFCTGV
jgi:hypothetical protein